jgi:hypothetical protein
VVDRVRVGGAGAPAEPVGGSAAASPGRAGGSSLTLRPVTESDSGAVSVAGRAAFGVAGGAPEGPAGVRGPAGDLRPRCGA